MDKIKRFLTNKNTITILGVVLIIGLLYGGYSYMIKKTVEPRRIPVAIDKINPRTEITEDMIEYIEVPNVAVSENVILNSQDIIGKYTNINTIVPKGSMFYKDVVIKKEDMPDIVLTKLKKGEILYQFPVSFESTYGNIMVPGKFIDIYMKATDKDDKVIIGKLIKDINVLSVNDSSGNSVFDNNGTPSVMLFGLQADLYQLLKKASYMDVDLFPVPHGEPLGKEIQTGTTQVTTQYLIDYINSQSIDVPLEAPGE